MTLYLTKMTLTNQGWAALVAKPQNRLTAVKPMLEAAGGKILNYWFAIDQGAIYTLWETPEELTNTLAVEMAVMSGGSVGSMESTRLVTAAEAMDAMKKASALGYRPIASGSLPAKK